ncbi:MAG: hypothetical protein JST00_11805 [Deltaproteobacteria bacterium]|nr:hypothetical protein [Deltaproteobacteria bacterium]
MRRFALKSFRTALTKASEDDGEPAHQVDYIARYCERLGAKTVVREDHYVDRHYLDEYGLYYSRALRPPRSVVRRFHVFARTFSEVAFSRLLSRRLAANSLEAHRLDEDLSSDYLGFISIRPVPSVPVGRTVLRRLDDGEKRDIWATGIHQVHLANLRLRVEGLAFQQQDLAVGACATAALWSALSRVTRHEGMRAPTPAEVSEAAAKHVLPHGRTLPAVSGLTVDQLAEAIRSTDFAPEAVRADEMPEVFVAALHTYLLSGIPVVLALQNGEGGHAVTAVGFQARGRPKHLLQSSVRLRSASTTKLYVHDDRLGPYARAFLVPIPKTKEFKEALALQIELRHNGKATREAWLIDSALIPVYPKLRLPFRSLLTLVELHAGLMEAIVGNKAPKLSVEFIYKRGGTYLSTLRIPRGAARALREVVLPRWCGIVRWYLGARPLADFVYDTTDILRDEARVGRDLIRATVSHQKRFDASIKGIANFFQVPSLP